MPNAGSSSGFWHWLGQWHPSLAALGPNPSRIASETYTGRIITTSTETVNAQDGQNHPPASSESLLGRKVNRFIDLPRAERGSRTLSVPGDRKDDSVEPNPFRRTGRSESNRRIDRKGVHVVKLRIFLGGLLVGAAIGIMVGGALVEIPTEAGGKRVYPQGLALILAIVGGIGAGSTLRGSAPK
jgi:hypothetical protein